MSHNRYPQRFHSLFNPDPVILSGIVVLPAVAVLAPGQSFVLPDAIFLIF